MGIKIPDISTEKAWGATEMIPEGAYNVRVVNAEERTSSGGHPQFVLDLEVLDTPQKGRNLRDWLTITPNTLGRIKGVLEALGVEIPEGEFELAASSLIGRTASVIVRHEDYVTNTGEHRQSAKVKAYEPAGEAFTPAPGKPVSAAQKSVDDIPF